MEYTSVVERKAECDGAFTGWASSWWSVVPVTHMFAGLYRKPQRKGKETGH